MDVPILCARKKLAAALPKDEPRTCRPQKFEENTKTNYSAAIRPTPYATEPAPAAFIALFRSEMRVDEIQIIFYEKYRPCVGQIGILLTSPDGYVPASAVEFSRKLISATERPSFRELESHVKQAKVRN
ncbi:hypothetical protein [Undibacterium sp.]|uniref:hypothetical protein n=1 Tax=Undibacterium sp. TaxID=1914977 RepID=UPI002BF9C22D|nr:hypothetical protein [Undibacterium sp.]HTD02752.1 hypothetical protein [Undibacterium sp.]